jgi:hypothetical protein
MSKIAVIIRNEYVAFYASLADLLSKTNHVQVLVDNPSVNKIVSRVAPDISSSVRVLPERRLDPQVTKDTTVTAVNNERRLGVRYSSFLAKDRALGRGYMSNIDGYPSFGREYWPHEQRLESLNREVDLYSKVLLGIDVLISQWPEAVPIAICEAHGIQHFHLLPIKFGDRYYWSTDSYKGSEELKNAILSAIHGARNCEELPSTSYEVDSCSSAVISQISYDLRGACLASFRIAKRDIYNLLKKRSKPNSVRTFGWIPSRFRKYRNSRFVNAKGIGLESVQNKKYIFFPLHMEPEVSLYLFSPEFINTFEALVWLSKSIPADWQIVVKEQPNGFQFRAHHFYQRLLQIGNIRLADTNTKAWDWIKHSQAAAVFTSTVGIEAVHFEKPVISFSRNQYINLLPTVFEARSFEDTLTAVSQIENLAQGAAELQISRVSLYQAQKSVSFPLENLPKMAKSFVPDEHTAYFAGNQLMTRYSKFLD